MKKLKTLLNWPFLPQGNFWILALLLLCKTITWAQNPQTISGTVTDENSQPLAGANVIELGTTNGTQTDFDGNFTLQITENAVISVSYIGFLSKEVNLNGQTQINIILQEDAALLDEVVVIGYGQQKRSDISGSVSEISQEKIAQNPSPNLSNALVGQTAGIIATQRSGSPGEDASDIFIRGVGTTGDISPIYVIDGIVRSSSDFAQLNPNEIQSFSVLKDAASAAVFGVRGGNGVVLVTTKRGEEGKMQISFSTSVGVQERTRTPEFLNSYEYAKLYNEALANQGDDPLYSDEDLQKYLDGSSPDTHPDSDWLSALKNTAMMQNYAISANGGTDKIKYATSFSHLNQDGIVPSNNFKRYNFRSNVDANVTNTTKLSVDLSGRDERTINIPTTNLFQVMAATTPVRVPMKWSNGEYSNGPAYLTLPDNGYRRKRVQSFRGRIELEQQLPIQGLSIKGIAAYDKTFTDNKNWIFVTRPFYNRLPDGTFEEGIPAAPSLSQDHEDYQSLTMETHLNYATSFGNNDLSGLVLYTQTKDMWDFLGGFRDGYTLGVDELNFGGAANRNNEGYSGTSARQGIVGRLNWTMNDKYILEGSFRADASEQFADGNRWGFFPSGSFAYIISREDFFENADFLDFLKLRGSYGVLGNDRLNNERFLYLQSYFVDGGRYSSAVFGDGNVQQTIVEGRLANPNVTWETVKKLNVGFDATFWGGQLSTTFDYFYDKRSDILGARNLSVPSLLGVGLPVENLSKVDNKGFELSLGHKNRLGEDFSYTLGTNFTYAKNEVIFIDEPESENPNIKRTGRSLNPHFGLNAIGLFQSQEEVDNAPSQLGNTGPGDIRFEDINDDGQIDDLDRVYIGSSNVPEIIYGINGSMQYKNLQFSFLFQGAQNVNQYYSGEGAWPFFVGAGALKTNLDRWTPENTDASEPRVLINVDNLNQTSSSWWLQDASYLRLKNVELAYNLPVDIIGKKFFQGVRLYINANNVYTWTKVKNYDPENASGRGWDYPQFRLWNFGINLQF